MKDKEKLKKFVLIIGELLKQEGNEWLIDEILKTISEVSPVEEIAKHSLIQNIHEFCVEQKIDKQAKEFYESFPIAEIKDQLILDYKKMEHERRRDDFENFCLSLYQQIENVINFLFDKHIEKKWDESKDNIAYRFPDGKTLTQKELIFGNANQWYANVKYKAVLYFYYYSRNIKIIIPFNDLVNDFNEIYQMRNQNHRGSTPTSYQQKTLNKIKGNESRYYFKFYGFLQDFVDQIESSCSTTSNSGKKNKKSSNPKTQKNTIGANSPELEKLKQLMKNNE